MSANLKAKLSEDRFEALALRVQWRHKTAAHHSTDQHTCVVSALLSLFPSFTWYLATSFLKAFAYSRSTSPRSFRYLPDKHITKCQLLISTPENHQLCGSGGVMGHHWNQRILAKRCEIDILLKPQANTLAVLFQAHQPLQVSALSPPAKFSKVLFSSSNCYEGKTNLPPIPKITAPTGHHSLQSVHHYLWKQDTCQQPTVTWGLSDSFELYQDWQVTI